MYFQNKGKKHKIFLETYISTPHHSGAFIFNFEQTSHFIIVKVEHTQSARTQFNKIQKEWVRDEDRPK